MEHVCNDQVVQLYKIQYMFLYFYQYLGSPAILNKITPPIGCQF